LYAELVYLLVIVFVAFSSEAMDAVDTTALSAAPSLDPELDGDANASAEDAVAENIELRIAVVRKVIRKQRLEKRECTASDLAVTLRQRKCKASSKKTLPRMSSGIMMSLSCR
jgi:hypothetical protein